MVITTRDPRNLLFWLFRRICGRMLLYVVIILAILLFLDILSCFLVKVKLGKPPLNCVTIFYEYLYLSKTYSKTFMRLSSSYPGHRLINFCFYGISSLNSNKQEYESAQGVIVSETGEIPNHKLLSTAVERQLTCFQLPKISHAIYSQYIIIPWLPITRWIALKIAHRKHSSLVQRQNLCAYPLLEIYSTYKLLVLAPLICQDKFVLPEAEKIVYGRNVSAIISKLMTSKKYMNPNLKSPKG